MLKRTLYILCIASLVLGSCKSKKRVASSSKTKKQKIETVTKAPKKENPKEESIINVIQPPKNASYTEIVAIYIENYNEIAMDEMRQYGIPASITLAQGILESGAGRGELSRNSNNHFGIKCHKGWKGERVYHDDDELQECFRKYKDPKTSFRDHSLFLTQRSRYRDLFSYDKDDYKSWAKGLKKAGYATDPKYPQKLINIIDRNRLYIYDQEVLDKKTKRKEKDKIKDKDKTYIVKKGDTLYSISRKFNISIEDLKKNNRLKNNIIHIGQVLVIR